MDYLLIKPHHFLDYLYELSIHNEILDENINGNNNAYLFKIFVEGKFKTIKFTPYIDDICSPCKKIVNGKCIDTFDEEISKKYGTNSKNEFNYNLDIKLNEALPNIFRFDIEQNMIDVLIALKESLTKQIIELYKWERPNRVINTFIGIDKAINNYSVFKA